MSGAALDMTLDDLIKSNKKSGSRGRGRGGAGGGGGAGPVRRQNVRLANRAAPYAVARAPESNWSHDMFQAGGRASNIETGTKLHISNLDFGVSNEDIKELFAEVGDLKRYSVHYDRTGRSKGTAEIVFSRRQDAVAAIRKYNNIQLDGKPMQLELVGTNMSTPAAATLPLVAFANSTLAPLSGQARGGFNRAFNGRGHGRGSGRGRGRGRGRSEKVSADDLDADLEKYHADAMQT